MSATTTKTKVKRMTVKTKHPNPLFEKWLAEWYEQAKAVDSKMQYAFKNALKSLQQFPLPLESGKDCLVLKGFGFKLCDMLDKKLNEYKATVGLDALINNQDNNNANKQGRGKRKSTSDKQSPPKRNIQYTPAARSGPHAILLTLLKFHPIPKSKTDIIEVARYLCDKSFLKPDPGSFYTAWSSMGTLVKKTLVVRQGNPPAFFLTAEGLELAKSLDLNHVEDNDLNLNVINQNKNKCGEGSSQSSTKTSTQTSSQSDTEDNSTPATTTTNFETIIFQPHTFDIILLVDTQETKGIQNKLDDEAIFELERLKVKFEVRHLNVGDFTWICRLRDTNQELVLPYIVERKRMDDFAESIKDGRFHEQKFRLKKSGIQNILYMVESYGINSYVGLPLSTLMQAATNTCIHDRFQVKFTENHRHSMQYLVTFTQFLHNSYSNKTVLSCPKTDLIETSILDDDLIPMMTFVEFNKSVTKKKQFKVHEMFVRHLLRLKGVSVEKALAITSEYPTPVTLVNRYNELDSGEKMEKLLANLQYGPLKRNVGPVISKTICQLYTSEMFAQ